MAETATGVRALTEAWALADRSFVDTLELRGEDRVRFLNGLVTCDVAAHTPGGGAYGFVTNHQGRILADVAVLALPDRLLLELPPGADPRIAEHMGKYIVADRVEVAAPEAGAGLLAAGPAAAERLSALLGELPPESPWAHAELDVDGSRILAVRHPRLGVPGLALRGDAEALAALAERLLEGDDPPRRVGPDALETVRVEAGIPRYGIDFGEDHFPQETGVEEAVSYTKGCYLGQEVVARIHYRGKVNRILRGLRFEAGEPPAVGTPLLLDGRPVGTVGSAVASPRAGGLIGLAILHRRGAEPGTRLDLEGGGAVVTQPGDAAAAGG